MFRGKQLTQDEKPTIFKFQNSSNSSFPYTPNNHQKINRKLNFDKNYEQSPSQGLQSPQNYQDSEQYLTGQSASFLDIRRVNRAKYVFQQKEKQTSGQKNQRKKVINMNIFREVTKQKQRQFHQQNHQYLRMFSVITSSAMNQQKFIIKSQQQGGNLGGLKGNTKASKNYQQLATVHLQLFTQLTSSLINFNFPAKDTYNIVPFKKQSIEFESRTILDPQFQFFIFEKITQKIEQIKHNLTNLLEEGLSSQFRATVIRILGNLNYFEYLDLTSQKVGLFGANEIKYPKEILQIAHQTQVFEIPSDQQEYYIKKPIQIQESQTDQRLVACEDSDLSSTCQSVYFEMTQEYTLYKKYRQNEFKQLKIYDKDISINTDIRNIISSEKIYLIELVKELQLYIELSYHQSDLKIMKQILKQLKQKAQEFLRLLCGYTESRILKDYNIENYHEKISYFIEKSIKYKKEVQNPSGQLLKEFPILKIWYELPQMIFGYSRKNLQKKYYEFIAVCLIYEEKINDKDLQRKLSIRRPELKYPQ